MEFTFKNKNYELILLTVTGSRMYGNAKETSDWDYRGVYIESINNKMSLIDEGELLGGQEKDGEELCKTLQSYGLDLKDTKDIEIYELKKFVSLALANNPNIMDLLCHNSKNSIYLSEQGQKLLENKSLFLSKELKNTFSGYALSQLSKINSHHKWINQYPETHIVLEVIKNNYESKNIDFDWITQNFGGQVALKTTNENAQNNVSLENTITWNQFLDSFQDYNLLSNPNIYRIPRLFDYCFPKDLKCKSLDTNISINNKDLPILFEKNISFETFLTQNASYRTFSPSMISIFDNGSGIMTKDGNLKPNDPKVVGDFICLLTINQMQYKSDKDLVNKMWNWKCNRNEFRSQLEDLYGYDLKHASHLVRLLDACKEILLTGDYVPELSDYRLNMVNDIRNGKYDYNFVIKYANKINDELDSLLPNSKLQDKPDFEAINSLYNNILSKSYNLDNVKTLYVK